MDAPAQTLQDYPEATDFPSPLRPGHRLLSRRPDRQGDAGVDALLTEKPNEPLSLGAEGPDPVRGRPAGRCSGAHQRSVKLKPDAPLLRINLAHALIETNDPANLDRGDRPAEAGRCAEPDNTLAWRLLSTGLRQPGQGRSRRVWPRPRCTGSPWAATAAGHPVRPARPPPAGPQLHRMAPRRRHRPGLGRDGSGHPGSGPTPAAQSRPDHRTDIDGDRPDDDRSRFLISCFEYS
jgi:hypothetical protein